MLRGCRWQLLLFLLAGLFFSTALFWRTVANSGRPGETPVPDPVAGATRPPDAPAATAPPEALKEAGPAEPHTYREGLVGPLRQLNPLLAEPGSPEAEVSGLIFEGLTRNNVWGEPAPALAQEWLIAANGLEYVVTLRDDVLWQDGVPFSAVDVQFTMSLLQAQDFPGDPAVGRFWRTVEVEVLAANVLRFRLTQPLGSFLDRLRAPILPWHVLQGTPPARLAEHPFNQSPVGTGAWQLETLHSTGDGSLTQVNLRPAPVWRERKDAPAAPAIGRLRFQIFPQYSEALAALLAGAIDGLAAGTWQEREALLAVPQGTTLRLSNTVGQTLGMLIFNWQREETMFFREQRVRLALATGIDRAPVVERLLHGRAVAADSPLWGSGWAWTAELAWPPADLEVARWLLETARSREDSDSIAGGPVTFSILAPEDATLVRMLREFADQWSRIGVEAEVETEAPARFQERLQAGDFDAALVELRAGESTDPDVYALWHEGQYPAGLNHGGVDDRRIAELLERARREPHSINRAALYEEFQQVFAQRAIAIPLYYPLTGFATAERVRGVQLGRAGGVGNRFVNVNEWWLESG